MPSRRSDRTKTPAEIEREAERLADRQARDQRRLREHNERVARAAQGVSRNGRPGRIFSTPRQIPAEPITADTQPDQRRVWRFLRPSVSDQHRGMPEGAPQSCPACGAPLPSYRGNGQYHCSTKRLSVKNLGCDRIFMGASHPHEDTIEWIGGDDDDDSILPTFTTESGPEGRA